MDDMTESTLESLHESLLAVCLEGHRFIRTYGRVVSKLPTTEQGRYASQMRFFAKMIDESLRDHGIELVSFEGTDFDPGLPITVVNPDEFSSEDSLVVDQMLEPAVIGRGGLIRMGSAVLRKKVVTA